MMLSHTVQMSQNHLSSNHGNFSGMKFSFESHCDKMQKRLRNFIELVSEISNERSFVRRLRAGVLTVPIQFHVWTTFTEILKTLLYIGSFSTVFDLAGHGLLCNYFCLFLSPPRQFFFVGSQTENLGCGLYPHILLSPIDSEDTSRRSSNRY